DDFALVYDRRNRAFHKKLWDSSTKSWTTRWRAPYSALVAKDGSTVWAEDASGKTIASGEAGVDDASVIQSAIESVRLEATKYYSIDPTDNRRNYIIPTVLLKGKFEIKQKIDIPAFPSGFEPTDNDRPIFIRIRGEDAILDCTECVDDEVFHIHGSSAPWIMEAYIENIRAYADPNNPTDLLLLEYFSGEYKNIKAYGFRRLVVMKTGWDPYFVRVWGMCYPNDSTLGMFHIIPTDYDCTNNVRLIKCGGLVKSTNGWVFRSDDESSHSIWFIHFHTHDGMNGDGALELSQFKGEAYITQQSNITHPKWAIYAPSKKVHISDSFIGGPVKITTGIRPNRVVNSEFITNPSNGNFEFSGASISNSVFMGQTVIKEACKVSNCKFYPKVSNQDFVLQCIPSAAYMTTFENILVTDYSPYDHLKHPCNTLILIGTRNHDFVSGQPSFANLEILSYKTKYGIYIETGNSVGSEADKVIISNARRLKINADGDYLASECYLIYSEVSIPIVFAGENIVVGEDKFTITNNWNNLRFLGDCKFVTTGNKAKSSGTATFSGDGSTADFEIGAHGLVITDPSKIAVKVTPVSSDAIAASPCVGYVDPADNTKIRVKFSSAPASGSENVKIVWYAEVIS
ncbi:MAG: hypothetical protein DRN06_06935, partial [Thermoprotei archaeon]